MIRVSWICGVTLLALSGCATEEAPVETTTSAVTRLPASENSFTTFETLQVRPLAIAGNMLFAANTPDNRLEMFRINGAGKLSAAGSVGVGLEPIAVAARNDNEIWVVNHLSD